MFIADEFYNDALSVKVLYVKFLVNLIVILCPQTE